MGGNCYVLTVIPQSFVCPEDKYQKGIEEEYTGFQVSKHEFTCADVNKCECSSLKKEERKKKNSALRNLLEIVCAISRSVSLLHALKI